MSAVATPEAAKPQFSASEAILAHGETKGILNTPDAIKHSRGIKRRDELKARVTELGKNTLAENLKLRGRESVDVRKSGDAKITAFKESFKGDADHPDHKTRADAAIIAGTNFLEYSQIEAATRGVGLRTPDATILKDYGIDEAAYKDMRNNSLDYMIALPLIRATIGEELLDGYSNNPDQQRLIMEVALARDPALRKRVDKAMAACMEEAKALPSANVENEATKASREKIIGADSDIKFANQQIGEWIKRFVPAGSISDTELDKIRANIGSSLRTGSNQSIDNTLNLIKQEIFNRDTTANVLFERAKLQLTITQIEDEIKKAKDGLGVIDTVKSSTRILRSPAEIANLEAQLARAKSDEKNAGEKITLMDPAIRAQAQDRFAQVMTLTSREADGSSTSPIARELSSIVAANQTKVDGERELQRALTSGERAQLATRAIEEAKLIKKMEDVMADAIEQTVLERNSVLGEIEVNEFTKAINERKDKWSSWNKEKGKYTRDRTVINEDIQNVLEYGDEAIRRMLLRDILKAQGTPIEVTKNGAKSYREWNTVDMDTELPAELKATLDSMEEQHGDKYASKLLSDYVASRSWYDMSLNLPFGKEIATKNTLTDSQLERLHDVLGTKLQNLDIKTGGNRAKAMEELKLKGIDPQSKKGKTLLWILLGGLAAAAIGPLGVGAAAVHAVGIGAAGGAVSTP